MEIIDSDPVQLKTQFIALTYSITGLSEQKNWGLGDFWIISLQPQLLQIWRQHIALEEHSKRRFGES